MSFARVWLRSRVNHPTDINAPCAHVCPIPLQAYSNSNKDNSSINPDELTIVIYCLFMFLFAWFDLNDDNIRVVVGVI